MCWGTHPDTITMAIAMGDAERTGFPQGSLERLKAYRAAYEVAAGTKTESLERYLCNLDERIAQREVS